MAPGVMRRHPRLTVLAVAGTVLAIFVVVWFQPQKLFIDQTVEEALPGAAAPEVSDAEGVDSNGRRGRGVSDTKPSVRVIAKGGFRPLAHRVSGDARLLRVDAERYLRLEDLMVENGPDLRVYLSAAPAESDGPAFGEDFVDLGALKGNIGDQNYEIGNGVDLDRFRSAVIWCRRFSVAFAVAPLEQWSER